MTDEELAEIRARAEAATPGPWLTPKETGDPYLAPALAVAPTADVDEGVVDDPRYAPKVIDHEGCMVWPWTREADMEFAYKAREDVPALLAELDRLRRHLRDM